LAAIGVAVFIVVSCFAFVGGWLSSGHLNQEQIVDTFEKGNGMWPGFRRNHAKGVCVAGYFVGNGHGVRLSRASVFRPVLTSVVGRMSLSGGRPYLADGPATLPTTIRSMALALRPAGGEEWRMAMLELPVFPTRSPESFYDLLVATLPEPGTGKPNPVKIAEFLALHPETGRAMKVIRASAVSSGFANASYNTLNAFRFIDVAGASTPVRWSMVAVDQFEPEPTAPSPRQDGNYLFDALAERVTKAPVQWRLVVTIGEPGDPTDDATTPWPSQRGRLDVGMLTINHIEGEAAGNCRDINFDPLVLPPGIAPSNDPLLSARSAAYSTSFTRRAGERKESSAVRIPDAGRGAK